MPYENYNNDIPVIYIDQDKQKWFENLEHISKFNIPKNYVSITKLKSFGIKANDVEAVAWAYQAHSHEVYLLFNLDLYKLSETATKSQIQKYQEHIKKSNTITNYLR